MTRTSYDSAALLANREMLSLERASTYLATRVRARVPLGAAEFLAAAAMRERLKFDKRVKIALDCMEIYRQVFPEQYARSSAPFFSTQREHELYRLIHTNNEGAGVPLVVAAGVDVLTAIESNPMFFLPFIPVRGTQRHQWGLCAFKFSEVELAFQIALTLGNYWSEQPFGWTDIVAHYGLNDCPAPLPPLAAVGWTQFVYSCQVEGKPLSWLPTAFNMIAYKTGNPWLDMPPIGYVACEWSIPKLMELSIMWANAKDQWLAVEALEIWLREDPKPRIKRVVELWNAAARMEAQQGMQGVYGEDLVERGDALMLGDDLFALRRGLLRTEEENEHRRNNDFPAAAGLERATAQTAVRN